MKVKTPEIVWHNKQPVFAVDFHRNGPNWRMVTGGADNDVKVWKVDCTHSGVSIQFQASLSRHTKAVNVVRFSPCGGHLASAGDDHAVLLWKMESECPRLEGNLMTDDGGKESWSVNKILRGHLEDIYDLCWSHDSNCIITGSVDNSAIVWDVHKGHPMHILKDSKQYVQGVAWDPLGKVVVSLSNDRTLRVYGVDNRFKCLHSVSKVSAHTQDGDTKSYRMWIDEGLNSFFRRLTFTPDGSFLIAPAGRVEVADKSKNASYLFSRSNWTRPVLQLPCADKATVVVKCCPVPFELREEPEPSFTSLPYRMVYAVASLDSVLLYDTQHPAPFAYVSNIHYSGITDLAWSNDGSILVVSSSDCYCSVITFEEGELGVALDVGVMVTTSKTSSRASTPGGGSTPGRKTPRPNSVKNNSASVRSKVGGLVSAEVKSPDVREAVKKENEITTLPAPARSSTAGTVEESSNGKASEENCVSTEVESSLTEVKLSGGGLTGVDSKARSRRVDFITLSSFKQKSHPVVSSSPISSTPMEIETSNHGSESSGKIEGVVQAAPNSHPDIPAPSSSHSEAGVTPSAVLQPEASVTAQPAVCPTPNTDDESSSNSQPRRVNFITLSSFKKTSDS